MFNEALLTAADPNLLKKVVLEIEAIGRGSYEWCESALLCRN